AADPGAGPSIPCSSIPDQHAQHRTEERVRRKLVPGDTWAPRQRRPGAGAAVGGAAIPHPHRRPPECGPRPPRPPPPPPAPPPRSRSKAQPKAAPFARWSARPAGFVARPRAASPPRSSTSEYGVPKTRPSNGSAAAHTAAATIPAGAPLTLSIIAAVVPEASL